MTTAKILTEGQLAKLMGHSIWVHDGSNNGRGWGGIVCEIYKDLFSVRQPNSDKKSRGGDLRAPIEILD